MDESKPVYHVLPVNDLKPHEEAVTCWCKPTVDEVYDHGIVIVHNSLDGREIYEQAEKMTNNQAVDN